MIKNNLIYGFNENGVIGYTKNAIGDMSVLVHEYAHTYFNNNETIDMLKVESLTTGKELGEEFFGNIRFRPLIDDPKENESQKYNCEKFATIIGVFFKKIQDKLPTYKSAEDMRKNLVKDVESVCGEELKAKEGYSIFIDVLKSMCSKQQQVKSAKTITMKDIKEQAKKVCETGTEQDAFVQGAIWALEQSGIKVEEKTETPKEEKTKKATAKKTTGKPKKATKKAKVADKPKYEIGTIFEDDSIIIGYKNGKYQIVTKDDELIEMTEKEIDEA